MRGIVAEEQLKTGYSCEVESRCGGDEQAPINTPATTRSTASTDGVPQNQQNASGNSKKSGGATYSLSENTDATQSQQFKRWFGDWQNHPESANKVVNEDGTPKVVYHGTGSEF